MFTKSKTEPAKPLEVLIIDDNEQITKMISSFLDMSNHECTVVNDGKEGLELIKTNQFDSIILDLAMPEFDGYEILNTLSKEDPDQLSKVIILTASSIPIETVKKFKELGISSCLQKPVDIDQLLSKITSVAE
ncbi:MAG: response regulator transcription factor [Nitrosopumilaceae archaeon]|jgi:DNA-binding response OmpR family regulator|uniref:Response regulator transcription factor n=2 Tax=Candidatus Nitrosomaritimum aestuariumsis TaxID=3342354 RepID=A0AC60W695_9ARCH|nr:response regulator transcription factor [Nitrosopumilaceae archaeon]MBA4462018.1 response regulator transcription factor [Nitrosopumilaceae archaeon]MBA4462577.1 response regulator transcription factor [Nitrosopumilaceae archaeon]